jgi:magnesium transporter
MIRAIYVSPNQVLRQDLQPEDFAKALQDDHGLLWVDFQGESPQVCEPILRGTFNFHPLAVDDALSETHVPKVDDWDQYLYVVLHAISFDQADGGHIDTVELDVFLGKNYVVTHHDQPASALDRVWRSFPKDERHLKMGADHILYSLTDELAVDYVNVVQDLDDEINRVEDMIFDKPNAEILERTFTLKRAVLRVRRTVSPQREVLNKLARDDYAVVDARDRVYFRDVYDHLVRLYDIIEGIRDLIGGVLDTYLSVINNRMNDIMKTLTIITTIFMPISFVTGFFGMNFFQPAGQLTAWTHQVTFFVVLAVMCGTPLTMLLWMRHRGWM